MSSAVVRATRFRPGFHAPANAEGRRWRRVTVAIHCQGLARARQFRRDLRCLTAHFGLPASRVMQLAVWLVSRVENLPAIALPPPAPPAVEYKLRVYGKTGLRFTRALEELVTRIERQHRQHRKGHRSYAVLYAVRWLTLEVSRGVFSLRGDPA